MCTKNLSVLISFILLLSFTIGVAHAAVQDGVEVAHCFDDLIDSSGNGHNAATAGGAYLSGGLVYFDGTSDYVNVGSGTWSSNPCNGSSNFTIAIAYASSQTGLGENGAALACIGDPSIGGGSGHLTIFTNNNGQYIDCWYVDSVLGGTQYSGLSYSFSDGNMHYCFITYNAGTDLVRLYALDSGSAVSGPSGTLGINTTGSNIYPRLGRAHDDPYNDFAAVELNGQIDLFAMWNRVLTTGEMEDVMESCGPPDTDPPTPDPATWSLPPTALDPYSIGMTATTATDPSGVRYYFAETSGNPGGSDSPWQTSQIYTDYILDPLTQYTYRTRSRDQSVNNNETDWSTPPASATTDPLDSTAPTPNPATWSSPPTADSPWQIGMTATTATDPSGVQYFFDETTGAGHDSFWQPSPNYTDFSLTPETQYTYQVKARDLSPNYNQTGWSTPPASATTDEIPTGECPDVDLDDDCDCDIDDAAIFFAQWLDDPPCVGIGDPNGCADLDEENDNVDNEDFAFLAADWQESGVLIPTNLVINEIMSNNDTTHPDPADGDYEDWIEIYNEGPLAVNMAGMYLADDGNIWQIPSGVTINVGEYKLFWADGEPGQGIYHTNFALSASGDSVTLYDTDGTTILDTVTFDQLADDISYGRWPNITGDFLNMDDPTPGAANTVGMAFEVYFSRPGGTFTSNFNLGLTTKSATATIRYTTDRSEPTGSSNLYTGLIPVSQTTWVRARAYDSGLDPSAITSKAYLKLHSNIYNFETNLPIVVIDTFNLNIDTANRDFHPVISAFIDTDEVTGNAVITDPADWSGIGGMHIRGSSSADMYAKKQYRFETWDENSPDPNPKAQYRDMDVSLLGMPADSDWIIHAPFSDKTLMRNYQIFNWSRQIGRYAVRCRLVELFLDKNDGNNIVSSSDYWGVYVLMEKIKRDRNRIDLAELGPSDNAEPEITGGYVLDKGGEEDGWATATYGGDISCVDPVWTELTSAQRTWIQDHFDEFESALSSGNYDNPAHVNYYGNYIDIGSFVDHHILVEFGKNVDGFVLSTYFFKERGGRINMGPIWDYNGGLAGADYICGWKPEGWLYESYDEVCCPDEICCDVDSYWRYDEWAQARYAWYNRLFDDPEFLLAYADNWFDHRELEFKTTNMLADVDNNVTVLTTNVGGTTPVSRNFTKWNILQSEVWPNYYDNCNASGATYMDYVNWMRGWIDDRLTWMDSEIGTSYGDTPPNIRVNGTIKNRGEYITTSDDITITDDDPCSGGGPIYYTTDGSDPRAHGGGIAGTLYSSSFTLSESKQIKARIRYASDNWSALNEATFAVGPVADNLRITEIMYNVNDPNHEYIELKNIGGSTIQLNLVKFTDGIDFTFPSTSLPAGGYCVVVRNAASFALRYPSFSGVIAGEFVGAINNAGERIELQDALGQIIHNFRFKDGWYPITDGADFSLNIIDPTNPDPNSWEYSEYWQPSSVAGGTPSDIDTGHVASPGDIVINEVMAHSNVSPDDWIELHNTTGSTINITGWFLSDNDNNFKKYEIPSTSILAGGYVVFTEEGHFGTGGGDQFAFSELGDEAYLCSGSGGELAGGFCTNEDFNASEDGVSFGRYTKSAAAGYDVDFVSMTAATRVPPNTNTTPKVGPIVITEIMYHPASNNYAEYVEIKNISGTTVPLDDWLLTDESGGIEYYIPSGTSLGVGQYLLLAKNEVALNEEFSPAGTVLEWVEGRLSNAGEKIQISKPGTPEPSGFVPYIRVDRVNYSDGSHGENFRELGYNDPWPTTPDGDGDSLDRINDLNYGNDVGNWQALATPTPGS